MMQLVWKAMLGVFFLVYAYPLKLILNSDDKDDKGKNTVLAYRFLLFIPVGIILCIPLIRVIMTFGDSVDVLDNLGNVVDTHSLSFSERFGRNGNYEGFGSTYQMID